MVRQKDDTTTMMTEAALDQEIPLPLAKKPSLAVLPFVNLSADNEQIFEALDIKPETGEMAHTIRKIIRDPDDLECY